MNILIMGAGVLGMITAINLRYSNPNLKITAYDKSKENLDDSINNIIKLLGMNQFEHYTESVKFVSGESTEFLNGNIFDAIFICVPTDKHKVNSGLDTNLVEDAITIARKLTKTIVVRSTLPVGFSDAENVIYWPAFFVENNPFATDTRNIVGISSLLNDEAVNDIVVYLRDMLGCNLEVMSSSEAELTKLATNAYLTTRLVFFNEIKKISAMTGCNFESVLKTITDDPRIGKLYCSEPFVGRGKCLSKDTSELATLSNFLGAVYQENEGNKVAPKF